jgi:3-oxoacyl-[acyl-carrier-protein] synthase I
LSLYLSEMGIVNALGAGKAEVATALLEGAPSMTSYGPLLSGRTTRVARVARTLAPLPDSFAELDCRNNRLLAVALDEIAPAVEALRETLGAHRIGVLIGTSTSGIEAGEEAVRTAAATGRFPSGFHYRQMEIGTPALFAARYLKLTGPRYTISTACSSSAKALASAARLIGNGCCDAAVVGGADSLCRLTVNGFDALESLSANICNPFSANRNGINIGEGACVFLLTRMPAPIALLGCGESSDGYHMSAPDPQGRGAELAMRAALAAAGLGARDIGYLNLHGTATPKNDEMESRVVDRVLGREVPCSSTKPQIGHTLGAAGAQEAGLCWLLLSERNAERHLPRQIWDGEPDPALPAIDLVGEGRVFERATFMSNSFAFGGSNVSVIVGRR